MIFDVQVIYQVFVFKNGNRLKSYFITFTCIFYISGKRVCVGYEDGSVKVWDMKTTSCLQNVNGL